MDKLEIIVTGDKAELEHLAQLIADTINSHTGEGVGFGITLNGQSML